MRLLLTLLLIGLPLAEIATFIQVGQWLGLGPTLALVLLAGLAGILVTTVANLSSVLGPEAGREAWLLPAIVAVTALVGLVWGAVLGRRPDIGRGLGRGEPEPLAELEHQLAGIEV